MTGDPRAVAARADAQRRFVVQHGIVALRPSPRSQAFSTAANSVLLRMAPIRGLSRVSAQSIIIAAGLGLRIVEHDGPEKFRVVDPYTPARGISDAS